MGDQDEKEELASKLLNIPTESLKQVLSKSARSVPCLYQFSLGVAKDLRKSMKLPEEIPDNYMIIKYGFTDDLERRTKEHEKKYGNIKGVKFDLMLFSYIDPKYLSQAETDMRNYFETNEKKIKFQNFKELIAINPKNKAQIKKQFDLISKCYAGCVTDLIVKIDGLNHKIQLNEEKHKRELEHEKHQVELAKHQVEIVKQQMESLKQKTEIDNLKNQIKKYAKK